MAQSEQNRELGVVGIWAPRWLWEQEGDQLGETAAELEQLGFGTLWVANPLPRYCGAHRAGSRSTR